MVLCSVVLNLIAIGSSQTATAIFNVTAPALDLSYVAVIFAHLLYGYKLDYVDERVQYSLGKWGKPVNILAITWVVFISVVLFFPTTIPITVLNMYVLALAMTALLPRRHLFPLPFQPPLRLSATPAELSCLTMTYQELCRRRCRPHRPLLLLLVVARRAQDLRGSAHARAAAD